ncbi:HD domain-containing protein [Acetobacterium tundrae]|uniref:HD domain-containing protein n=1 Tax=Acetobacterium tundrae TaxID=132932 RepID=A0ABR6WQV3_9FIRM|nr:HD domain-containing protein [Acetobacterium tundrae]MBC3798606.1 HD domain-containing protein [Acetobacterium tundrae]
MDSLKNTNHLLQNKDYQKYLTKIKICEDQRKFCRHDVSHYLSVARIATIKAQESGLNFSRDLIYTTALLHDIGRFVQYENKTPHELASHELAIPLLNILDYDTVEKGVILDAILNHRNPEAKAFSKIFYESDKISRECFSCPVEKECDWPTQKKNLKIIY